MTILKPRQVYLPDIVKSAYQNGAPHDVLAAYVRWLAIESRDEWKDRESGGWLCRLTYHGGEFVTVPVMSSMDKLTAVSALWSIASIPRHQISYERFVENWSVEKPPKPTPEIETRWIEYQTAGNRGLFVYGDPLGMNTKELMIFVQAHLVEDTHEQRRLF